MLASLIVLSAFMGPKGSSFAQNPQFPKPSAEPTAVLQDSTIFKYVTPGDKLKPWQPLEVGRDWSNLEVPAIKPDAMKLRVLLAVAERDFSNPEYSNTLEMRDKTRLIEAMARLKSLFAIVSDGTINLEVVPRFIQEPIYDIREFKQLINAEYNKSKFESDDSIERGPFAAVIAISSSHVSDKPEPGEDYSVHGFSDLGGSGQDMWFEEGLFYVVQSEIFSRISNHFSEFKTAPTIQESRTLLMDRLGAMRGEYQRFFDPNFRQDADLVSKWGQQMFPALGRPFRSAEMSSVQSPASISAADGVLTYSELSIFRAGEFALPGSDSWASQKGLKFEVRSKGRNPIAVKLWLSDGSKKETLVGGDAGTPSFAPENNWQTVSIGFEGKSVVGASIGAPSSYFGKTRMRSELVQCDFRNFELLSEAPNTPQAIPTVAPSYNTEAEIKTALTTGNRLAKRQALSNLEAIRGMKGLESTLLTATGELDAGVAHDATKAYFELMLAGQTTPDQLTALGKFLVGPPNNAAREVALSYVTKNPSFAKYDMVVGNVVHESWRVRRVASIALGALMRANIKEKEGCHQMLLLGTSQEMAIIRLAAVSQLDPAVKLDNQRLEFMMVNDPCESVRLACLSILATSSNIQKEKLLGSLADDSPSLRERIPVAVRSAGPILREVLQKLVVDQDPYVRLSAVRNLAIVGGVKEGEIQNLFTDKHPAVQLAILQGAASGAWRIPADALAKLKESPIPAIKKLAMELK